MILIAFSSVLGLSFFYDSILLYNMLLHRFHAHILMTVWPWLYRSTCQYLIPVPMRFTGIGLRKNVR